jgi:hypothetical protein
VVRSLLADEKARRALGAAAGTEGRPGAADAIAARIVGAADG